MRNFEKIKNELENLVSKNESNNDLKVLNHYKNIYLASLSILKNLIKSSNCEFENLTEEKISFICHKMTDYCEFEMNSDVSFEDFQQECFDYYFCQKSYFFSDYENDEGKIDKDEFYHLFEFLK